MKKTFINQFDMFPDWFQEYKIPVLVAEKDDLEKSKLVCLEILKKLKYGWSESFVINNYTVINEEENYIRIKYCDFPLLISNTSLEKYKLKYLLELAIDCLDEEIEKGNELIKMKIAPK